MLSLIEPSKPRRFPAAAARPSSAFAESNVCVFDSASYQSLLESLGLRPDPRLCVPAVDR